MIRSVAQGQPRKARSWPVECWVYQGKQKPLSRAQNVSVTAITHAEAEALARERFKDRHVRSLVWVEGPKLRVVIDPQQSPRAARATPVDASKRPAKIRIARREAETSSEHERLLARREERRAARAARQLQPQASKEGR